MLTTTIDRGMSVYSGGIEMHGEFEIIVLGRVVDGNRVEIDHAYRVIYHWPSDTDINDEVDLTDEEEERALAKLEAMLPEYLAELAERANDERVDQAKEDRS